MTKSSLFWTLSVALLCTAAAGVKEGKVFSLFNVIQFQNEGCRTDNALSGSYRNGTCYTAEECVSKGGAKAGNCAAGFGVCCLFTTDTCGSAINQNCTYIRNPDFPSALNAKTSTCAHTINKCAEDVCQFRLDFEAFSLLGQTLTTEADTTACPKDRLVITSTSANTIPRICGQNAGQHVYIDAGNLPADTASLTFTMDTTTTSNRQWEIKVTQIKCNAELRAPDGCLQYFVGITGRFTTFNFDNAATAHHLQDQRYSACFRQEEGFCCNEYAACSDTQSFNLDGEATALVDTSCTKDFVIIEGAGFTCNAQENTFNRFCGSILSTFGTGTNNHAVCDCSPPFWVGIRTDVTAETVMDPQNRGLCLDYRQIPCGSLKA